jgi:excisionase family DNA binding protein
MTVSPVNLTPRAVAERLGVHYTTVLGLIKRGDLYAFRIGTRLRVPVAALNAFVANVPFNPDDPYQGPSVIDLQPANAATSPPTDDALAPVLLEDWDAPIDRRALDEDDWG